MLYLLFYFSIIFPKTLLVLHRSKPMLYVSYNQELMLVNEYHKNPINDRNNNVKIGDKMFLVNDKIFCAGGENKSLKVCGEETWETKRLFNTIKLMSEGLCLSVNNYNKKNNKIQKLALKPCTEGMEQVFSTMEISSDDDEELLFQI
ncbi:hypothetical protein SLOPH_2564 [Spraguea lophii 42_110]|uniref:Ricin B lectin domain-containing protein n=1 Tax=Spraguea lophii (strain 42_110) TaxID=1358809 RepID=S7XJ10_SPRLO|nr:hypothetical protein SLOPH_2564 [Spraguea lophii 42_110]